jgi:predicted transglutaminase-like cysteine proteinase
MQEPVFSVVVPQPAPMQPRFFSINQVLAKVDGGVRRDASRAVRLAALQPAGVRSDAPAPALAVVSTSDEPFGLFTFRAPEGLVWVKWRGVETEMTSETAVVDKCRADLLQCASAPARRLIALVDEARRHEGLARIDIVNRAINAAIRYTSDFAQFGVADKWSAPLATLGSGMGDCEDYAIAKYMVLEQAGIASDDLRLLLVRDRMAGQDHAVLAVRHSGRWLILDNRHAILQDAAEIPHFLPLFAIDRQGVKLFAAPYAERPVHESETIVAPASAELEMGSMGAATTAYLL